MKTEINGIPRRIRLDLNRPAELAIHNAMMEVEKMPGDLRLTNAVIKLQEAKNLVSDFIDDDSRFSLDDINIAIERQWIKDLSGIDQKRQMDLNQVKGFLYTALKGNFNKIGN